MFDLTSGPGLLQLLARAYQARRLYEERRAPHRRAAANRAAFYADAWRSAAAEAGASVTTLADDILEIRVGRVATRVWRNRTALEDPVTMAVAGNKALVCRLLAARGLSTPSHVEFTLEDMKTAIGFLDAAERDCVVKPANGAAGRGVTTGVRSHTDLAHASAHASAYGGRLLIEEQLTGDNYRLLYLDGALIDAIVRRHPTAVADGRSSIRKLVVKLNEERLAAGSGVSQRLLSIDFDMRRTLARQGYTLSSRPRRGTRIVLKTVVNDNAGTDNVPAAHLLCASIINDGASAAECVGARLAGVDIITRDPSLPLADTGGAILEVNTTPGFYFHYHQVGARVEVARHVLAAILRPAEAAVDALPST